MRRRIQRDFFLVLIDDDRKRFNIVGPMTDDTSWNERIVQLQESGRNVRCFSASTERNKEQIAEEYARQMTYEFTGELITDAPRDTSAIYRGPLPEYAQLADRQRVVRFFCKKCSGDCAEMNVPYPGRDVLRASQVGAYVATCLRCGESANDCYNWYR